MIDLVNLTARTVLLLYHLLSYNREYKVKRLNVQNVDFASFTTLILIIKTDLLKKELTMLKQNSHFTLEPFNKGRFSVVDVYHKNMSK